MDRSGYIATEITGAPSDGDQVYLRLRTYCGLSVRKSRTHRTGVKALLAQLTIKCFDITLLKAELK